MTSTQKQRQRTGGLPEAHLNRIRERSLAASKAAYHDDAILYYMERDIAFLLGEIDRLTHVVKQREIVIATAQELADELATKHSVSTDQMCSCHRGIYDCKSLMLRAAVWDYRQVEAHPDAQR
jgi:hypothetical protein